MTLSRRARLSALAVFALTVPAYAQVDTPAPHAIIYDYDSSEVLFCKSCDVAMPPSSMSKLMTAELVFQRLKDGRLKPTDTFHVSETAWRQGQKDNESKMWVAINSDVSVDDLLKGIIVQSGGDACVVVAEALGGTEAGFAQMENKRAVDLGLTHSHFVNSSGLPDPGQTMSAEDLAKLSAHIIREYPEYYAYFKLPDFTWSKIKQANRNGLLAMNIGADGLKTGHTDAGGYGIVGSAVQGGRRLIVVVNGLESVNARNSEAARLLGLGFREFKRYELLVANDVVGDAPVWGGAKDKVALMVSAPVRVSMAEDARRDMKVTLHYDGPVAAPIAAGQQIGTLTVTAPGKQDITVPVVASEAVPRTGIVGHMLLGLRALVPG